MIMSKDRLSAPDASETKRQLDLGKYVVTLDGKKEVGYVIVEAADKSNAAKGTVEHWFLNEAFPSPGQRHPDVTLHFKYQPIDPSTDMSALIQQHKESTLRSRAQTYIVARCTIER